MQSRTLYRLAGWAGVVGAALLFVAVARRGGLVPENLLDGPTGTYFLVVAMLFLVGVITFGIASLRGRTLPVPGVALYVLGFAPAALRGIVPEAIYLGGLTVGALGVGLLSTVLIRAK